MASILLKEKSGHGQSREGEDPWECRVFKGEFVVQIPHQQRRQIKGVTPNYRLYRDPKVLLYAEPIEVAPVEEREIEYLQAVQPASARLKEYLNENKETNMDLVVGDKVIFKLKLPEFFASKATTPTASVNGTIRYIGPHPDSDGIVFGIEIDDQAYRGKGTSNGRPYFTCGPNNAVFVAMDKIIKRQDPSRTRSGQGLPELSVMEPQPRPATRSLSETKLAASGQPKGVIDRVKDFVKSLPMDDYAAEDEGRFEVGDVSGHKSRFKEGDRVILQTVKEDIVAGTVRWVGSIRVSKDMKVDPLPVIGIETDRKIDSSKDFNGVDINVTGSHGKVFKVSYNHSRVFLPEQMVLTIDEYTMQKQKDHAAKFEKETKMDDATENDEKKLATEFGMSVAEYRRQQQSYVDFSKKMNDRRIADESKIEDMTEEKFAVSCGIGEGEEYDALSDTIQVMRFAGLKAVEERVEREGRALEDRKRLKEEIHQLQASIENLQLEKDTQQKRAEQQEQQWRNEKQQLLEEQDRLREEVKLVQEQIETDKQALKEENGQLKYENERLRREITDLREAHHELQQETEKKEQVQAQLQSQVGLFSIENMRLKGQVKQLEESKYWDKNEEYRQLQDTYENLRRNYERKEDECYQLQKSCDALVTSNEDKEERIRCYKLLVKKMEADQASKQNELARLEKSWKISSADIEYTKTKLGTGGWAKVTIGKFRGKDVAVKRFYKVLLQQEEQSSHYMELLHREINTMSQLRHPNLLQFIGAVLDHPKGNPMIITEVMDTSLRSAYERKELTTDPGCRSVILSIMRDVAVGLNYLHCLPDPIIHRDVSSANVLLESKGHNKWKTKISDFGSANLAHAAVTAAPGALVYSAPESHAPYGKRQTIKMDSYSYGVLLCEMITCRFPKTPGILETLSLQVKVSLPQLHELIISCINEEPDKRPTMSEIIVKLDCFIV
ncbi:PREDICTED: cyclin-dependent kinase 11A-like isoform X2 [Amphimedon queenslandica]|uniref:Protein kinase domain-containing protein n=2 Tax=Amphimedon queenslandica TaxID=400682 RepID=A0AAN0K4W7_AMPQE|nr:PREDICTED: cyclin-dependent kinase 11A-like isoform X2 [Amphimedon queenslandica]|eukprot:XP_019864336.1 PREDICTED: cyclin-dependent kinase 11A-like isoform X2 [Amphimedon queenslandica]